MLKAGHSSIAVTLPKPWAEAMNLRPGDLVVFDQNDDGPLYLKPAPLAGGTVGSSPYLVYAPSFEAAGTLSRLVTGAYRVGHDAIEIRTERPLSAERMEEIQEATRHLLGVSVVAQEANRVVLQNFIDPSKYGLPQLVQRMKMILIALLEEAEGIVDRRSRSKRLGSLQEETHRVLSLLVRQQFLASRDWSLARRIGCSDPRQLLEWRVVVHALDELSGLFGEIVGELNRDPAVTGPTRLELLGLVRLVKEELRGAMETLQRPSLLAACEAHAASDRLREAVRGSARRLKGAARRAPVAGTFSAVQRAASSLRLLAELSVDRAVAQGTETVLVAPP